MVANHRRRTPHGGSRLGASASPDLRVGLYQWVFYIDLVNRAGELTQLDIVVGIAALVILFAVVWRLMGAALPLICLAFLAYALLGQ